MDIHLTTSLCEQDTGAYHNIEVGKKSFKSVARVIHLGTTQPTKIAFMQKAITNRIRRIQISICFKIYLAVVNTRWLVIHLFESPLYIQYICNYEQV